MTWFLGVSAKRKHIVLETAAGDADDALMEMMKASEECKEASSDSFSATELVSNEKNPSKVLRKLPDSNSYNSVSFVGEVSFCSSSIGKDSRLQWR